MQFRIDTILPSTGSGSEEADSSEHVSMLASAILRRWRLVLLVAVSMVLIVYAVLQTMGDVYTPKANLLVKVGRENLEVPAVMSGGGVVSTGVRKEDINSDVSLLVSRALIERTVDMIGLDAFARQPTRPETIWQSIRQAVSSAVQGLMRLAQNTLIMLRLAREQTPREQVINRIDNTFTARREGDSDVIGISLRGPDPELGARFLTVHIEQFMEQRSRARRSDGITQFFNDRVSETKARLDQLDQDIMLLRTRFSLASVDEERINLLRRAAELDVAIALAASASTVAEALSRFVPRNGDEIQSGAGVSPSAVRARIAELIIERAPLLERFTADAQPLKEMNARIGYLTALLERSAAKEIATLTEERTWISKRLETLNDGELKLDRLNMERTLARERYAEDVKQRDAALVGAELERRRVANVSVLTPPSRPSVPDSPRRLMIMLITLPLGLLLGVALAALFAFLDPRVFCLYDVRRASGAAALGAFRIGRHPT